MNIRPAQFQGIRPQVIQRRILNYDKYSVSNVLISSDFYHLTFSSAIFMNIVMFHILKSFTSGKLLPKTGDVALKVALWDMVSDIGSLYLAKSLYLKLYSPYFFQRVNVVGGYQNNKMDWLKFFGIFLSIRLVWSLLGLIFSHFFFKTDTFKNVWI